MDKQLQKDLEVVIRKYMQSKLKDKTFVARSENLFETRKYFKDIVGQVVVAIFEDEINLG